MNIDASKKVQIIHLASKITDPSIIKLLVDRGADIDALDSNKWTPLMIASMQANIEVVRFLVREGANKGIEDIEGKTAREHAIEALEQEKAKP